MLQVEKGGIFVSSSYTMYMGCDVCVVYCDCTLLQVFLHALLLGSSCWCLYSFCYLATSTLLQLHALQSPTVLHHASPNCGNSMNCTSPCTISGLDPGTEYQFTVIPNNNCGSPFGCKVLEIILLQRQLVSDNLTFIKWTFEVHPLFTVWLVFLPVVA